MKSLSAALLELSDKTELRKETARLNDVMDEIESLLQAGIRRKAIFEVLQAQGFKMTFESFETTLHRLRKKRANKSKETVVAKQPEKKERPLTVSGNNVITEKSNPNVHESTINRYLKQLKDKKNQREQLGESMNAREGNLRADESKEQQLTDKQRWEALGDRFIRPENTNPVLKRLQEKEKEKTTALPASVKDTPDSA